MDESILLERITVDQGVMAGKPILRGTRLTVEFILNLLAHGSTWEAIIEEYPDIAKEDIQAVLLFARRLLEQTEYLPLITEESE